MRNFNPLEVVGRGSETQPFLGYPRCIKPVQAQQVKNAPSEYLKLQITQNQHGHSIIPISLVCRCTRIHIPIFPRDEGICQFSYLILGTIMCVEFMLNDHLAF